MLINNKHCPLNCQLYDFLRRDLFCQLTVSGLIIYGMDTNILYNLILFGSNDLNVVLNRVVIEATIYFIEATKRLD